MDVLWLKTYLFYFKNGIRWWIWFGKENPNFCLYYL